jgi:pimeloyl-ACP methyl ester carboxylesterase
MDNRFFYWMDQSKRMNVYFISGLGADRKAFERIKLSDRFVIHYLDWITPTKKETLNSYAKRLSAAIDTSQPFSVVGLSMGGMMASAMTHFIHPYKTILISSVACSTEFPPLIKLARLTHLHKLVPAFILRHPNILAYWLFGARTKNEKSLMHYLVSTSDPQFVKWAMGAILNWKDNVRPSSLYHIHGRQDKILPVKYTKPDVVIENGSHFMVWTKAGKVSSLVEQALT